MNPISQDRSPRQQMTERLGELACALDGFPVEALMTDCLEPAAAQHAGQVRTTLLVDRVLNQWIARLEQDIEQLPPSTLDVIRAISQRTHATREALIEVRRLFARLAAQRADAGVALASNPRD
jgi:hypothetical protein